MTGMRYFHESYLLFDDDCDPFLIKICKSSWTPIWVPWEMNLAHVVSSTFILECERKNLNVNILSVKNQSKLKKDWLMARCFDSKQLASNYFCRVDYLISARYVHCHCIFKCKNRREFAWLYPAYAKIGARTIFLIKRPCACTIFETCKIPVKSISESKSHDDQQRNHNLNVHDSGQDRSCRNGGQLVRIETAVKAVKACDDVKASSRLFTLTFI
jgi:hypothetical protein